MRKNKTLLIVCGFAFVACTAKNTDKEEVYNKYLACYALAPSTKQQCLQEIQFEGEKLGFKGFLKSHGLRCNKIEESPIFNEKKQAYQVKCIPNQEYLVRFNYDNKQWKLIKGE